MAVRHTVHTVSWVLLPVLALLGGCVSLSSGSDDERLPTQLAGKAEVLVSTDADYPRAVITSAVKAAGDGGVVEGTVIRLKQDVTVWRLWSGPTKKNASGLTNRIGGWWAYDAPKGTQAQYRTAYEICNGWNDLTWVAKCTLKAGAVVVIGPGQSVSAQTCGDVTGAETYPANQKDWQTYVDKPWARPTELVCPADTEDYEANPADISKAKAAS
ncbi:hypothetical protein [Sphaerotilus sp.]|jgi:hypothetical protein|uniref:hypothetical protein n=1 Tax=Sphaerotilus sp. TaxID=2093942 RepID=UPI0025E65A05|nr:hypothetical protein [Sphaerotilus sp.]